MLNKPGHYMGAWREQDGDVDRVWLDVSIVAPDPTSAAQIGREHNQIAAYNLATGETVDLGGTGEANRALSLSNVPNEGRYTSRQTRGPTREAKMGELRGGYIPGNLDPDDQAEAERLLFEHIMGGDEPKTPLTPEQTPKPPRKRQP